MPQQPEQTIDVDVAVIGGGIAGLWLLNRLVSTGYNAILFEHRALGSDQTVASQGMIHGGIKYTLGGALSGASEAIADMPEHWRACLRGEGNVDLRGVSILSDHFYMWSSGSAVSKMSTFFASKATRGRVQKVSKAERPAIFQNTAFGGSLYKLVDMVLDVPAIIKKLSDNCPQRIFQINWDNAHWQKDDEGNATIIFKQANQTTKLRASQVVLTAGQGNEQLLRDLGLEAPQMQRRPLQQVMVQHHYPHRFYGHCLGADTTPRLTISSHPCGNGQVWYLGGSLAEKGADQTAATVIANAKKELRELMPWVDLSTARWATLPVNRAEPRQRNFARPDKAFAEKADNYRNLIVAWPTKLTLSPNLADEVTGLLEQQGITPSGGQPAELGFLAAPPLAPTPWQVAFPEDGNAS